MRLALEIASASTSSVPLGKAAESVYRDMLKRQPELANKDFSSVYQYLQKAPEDGNK